MAVLCEVTFQRSAELRSGTVEEHTLMGAAQAKDVTPLVLGGTITRREWTSCNPRAPYA
jgi:hypothetical protein